MKIILLRLEKWWKTKVIARLYPNLPFGISWTNLNEGQTEYEYPNDIEILAQFDIPEEKRKYIITKLSNKPIIS